MSTDATRVRSAVFFAQYLALLLTAAVWLQFDFARQRVGDRLALFYLLLGATASYGSIRAYLVLTGRMSRRWDWLWLSFDMMVITCAVYLTGGIDSEAALLYFWPIATSSIQRLPRKTVVVGGATALLYLAATWQDHGNEKYVGTMVVRIMVLVAVTSLATCFALTEAALIEELARMREQKALANYRARLSREMHDGIQHYLAGITMRLELARKLMPSDPGRAAQLAVDQRFAIRRASAELRYLVRLLQSPAVEREGFVEALRHHLSMFAEASSISAPLEIIGEADTLPPEVAHAAFRIVQEAVMNTERHAHATEVKVTLSFRDDHFECTIKDNGVGFDAASVPEAPGIGRGFGLPGMVQRAQSVEGEVHVSSVPGEGTLVSFTVPTGAASARRGL